jgi:hypothetical protein
MALFGCMARSDFSFFSRLAGLGATEAAWRVNFHFRPSGILVLALVSSDAWSAPPFAACSI